MLRRRETIATLIIMKGFIGIELYDLNKSLIARILDALGLTRY